MSVGETGSISMTTEKLVLDRMSHNAVLCTVQLLISVFWLQQMQVFQGLEAVISFVFF